VSDYTCLDCKATLPEPDALDVRTCTCGVEYSGLLLELYAPGGAWALPSDATWTRTSHSAITLHRSRQCASPA